jgi:fructan beta-fructosidase
MAFQQDQASNREMKTQSVCIGILLLAVSPLRLEANERADILVADFEGDDYGAWKATGEAFGKGPARGTLPQQMAVTGYRGKGLVNSFHGGDRATGTLTSPEFPLERRYLNFLIGGGKHPGETCLNLLVDGKIVRTASGPNDRPGGSEQLAWHTWDVAAFAGKKGVLQIVDKATGGWGHITIDHIVLSDRQWVEKPARRDLDITARYLHLPVKNGAPKRRMRFLVDGQTVRELEIELADGAADFHVFSDVSAFKGKKMTLAVDALPADSQALSLLRQDEALPAANELYREKHRPQFHFTARRGWLNDPNGLVYCDGEYHLFYQHNPYGWEWGNMHWGHAVSNDLFHWRELPEAIYPRRFGDWAFSGSAVVDKDNTSGWRKGDEPLLVAAFTSTGRGECIVFSKDRGRTWTEYSGNPVVKHTGRDPRLLWHPGRKCWIMAVYDEAEGKQWIAFYSSSDLKKWHYESRIDGFFECPDLFALPIEGEAGKAKWVLYGADGQYLLGDFDGRDFRKESGKHRLWYGNFYAAQTFSNVPDGRRIQIGWGQGIAFPGMPFNQQMTVPCQLTLRKTSDGVRMFAEPVRELDRLRGEKHHWDATILKPGENPLAQLRGDLFELRAEVEVKDEIGFAFMLRGVPVVYDAKKHLLTCKNATAPLMPLDGRVQVHLLLDRGSIEIFGNRGQVAVSVGVVPADKDRTLALSARGGPVRLRTLDVFTLRSVWPQTKDKR